MYRKTFSMILAVLFVIALPFHALAANPHFVGPVTFADNGATLTASGSVAGLGNEDITVVLTATGTAEIQCRNPGGNVAPGQDTTVTATGTQSNIEVKNGRAHFNVTTEPVPAPSGAEVCPNRKWTAEVVGVTFHSATLTVYQGGEQVLQESRSF